MPKTATKKKSTKKPRGRPFKEGNNHSKGHGRPKLSPEIKAITNMNVVVLQMAWNHIFARTKSEIKELQDNEDTPYGVSILIECMEAARKNGSYSDFDKALSRIVGKPPETINIGNVDDKPFKMDLSNSRKRAKEFLVKRGEKALKEKERLQKEKRQKRK